MVKKLLGALQKDNRAVARFFGNRIFSKIDLAGDRFQKFRIGRGITFSFFGCI
ncbi:MAG: hypothetical protein QG564_423 [Campylobacterota bacterium]|nr:hypothetical protein [Campylobacterota bacterium]